MLKLETFHFDTDEIKITPLMKNEEALAAIRAQSGDVVPQKVRDVYGEVCFPDGLADRPYTFSSIVLSADGKMAYTDTPKGPVIASSNQLDPAGGTTDFWVLNMLRAYSDAMIIGARTLQAEPEPVFHIYCEELAKARTEELGMKTPFPWDVAVSFDGTDVPLDHMIFNTPELTALIATSEKGGVYLSQHITHRPFKLFGPYVRADEADGAAIAKSMEENPDCLHVIATGTGDVPDSAVLLSILRRMGARRALIESPSYMWHLMENKALDEMFINYSMVFTGGEFAMGLHQPFTSEKHPHSELLMLGAHKSNFIFTRQRLHYEYM